MLMKRRVVIEIDFFGDKEYEINASLDRLEDHLDSYAWKETCIEAFDVNYEEVE
jgi:hypothetical protein